MKKTKIMYCPDCIKDQVHTLRDVIVAANSASPYPKKAWVCDECGHPIVAAEFDVDEK